MTNSFPFQQLRAKPKSSKLAIKAMCAQCSGGPSNDAQLQQKLYDSDWKATIKVCPTSECPLHNFRPYKPVKRHSSDSGRKDLICDGQMQIKFE